MLVLLALSKKSVGIFFEFLVKRSLMFEFVLRDNGGLSKAHIARNSCPTPLVYVITTMVVNHAPAVLILTQFPSGSMGVNLGNFLALQVNCMTFLKTLHKRMNEPSVSTNQF